MATILEHENSAGVMGTMNAVRKPICKMSPSARRLCDITNVTQNVKLTLRDDNKVSFSTTESEIIEKLRKENATMLRAIAERDRVIEIRSHDVQKLKESMVKVTQQNWQLAQSNSQLLAELNIGKDKLKLQQHEFGVMSGMLKAKILELKGQVKNMSDHAKRSSDSLKEPEPEKLKLPNQNQRRQSRIPSQVSTGQVVTRVCTDSKRICVRRRSSIIKREEPQETEDQSKKSKCDKVVANETKVEEKEEKGESTTELNKPVEEEPPRRSSITRPARRASQKVTSYKEMSIKAKMRRDN
ncbi:unnamed protein product [Victoria cruziana]